MSERRWDLEIVPEEAEALRRAFEMRAAGSGYLAIAEWLNGQGFRPRSKRGLSLFGVSGVQSLLENRFYAGFVQYKGEWRRGRHEAVVSEELFERAQGVKGSNARPERRGHLLSGLARCGVCGGPLWKTRTGAKGWRYDYLREPSRSRGRVCAAQGRMTRFGRVADQVGAMVGSLRMTDGWAEHVRRLAAKPVGDDAALAERVRLEALKRRAERMWVQTGDEEFAGMVREAEAGLRALPVAGGEGLMVIGERLSGWAEAWGLWTEGERNVVLRALCERVTVDVRDGSVGMDVREEFAGVFEARVGFVGIPPAGVGGNGSTWMGRYTPASLGVA